MAFLYRIDAEELKRIHDRASSRRVKRDWIKEGYNILFSLYGAYTDLDTKETFGRRIEILSDTRMTESLVYQIITFFEIIKPKSRYSIWIYDGLQDALKCVGRYR